MNDSRKHLGLAKGVDNTSSDWNDNSFVYYGLRKSNTGTQDMKLATRGERTAIDESTKSVGNKKHPVVVDLTLDDSDDEDGGVGGGSAGQDDSKNCGSINGAVGSTSVSDSNRVGVSSGSSRVGESRVDSEVVSGGGSRVGVSRVGVSRVGESGVVGSGSRIDGNASEVVSVGSSRVGVSSGVSRVGESGVVGSGSRCDGSASEVVSGGSRRASVSSGVSRVSVSRVGESGVVGSGSRFDGSASEVVSGGSRRVSVSSGVSRVGVSRVGESGVVGSGSRVDGSASEVVSGGGSRVSVSSGGGTRFCGSDDDIEVVSSNDSRIDLSSGGSRINGSSEIVVNIGGSRVGVSGGRSVVINGGDSVVGEDGDDIISQGQPNTLPKILSAYSLNSGHPSYPATELRNLLSQKAKENVVKVNGMVVNGSADILTKGPNPGMLTASPLKNGIISQPKNDVISNNNQSSFEPIASNRNDVMNDVTNLRNEESSTKKHGDTQMLLSNWSVRHDSNLDTILRDQDGATSPTETGDQVIITKVVTSADKSYGRKQHPRKAPVQIRKLYFEENSEEKVIPSPSSGREGLKRNRKTNSLGTNSIERPEKRNLEETIASLNGNINGTPWSFTMKSDHSCREEKIRNLKARLSKQQEAVEKLRTKEKTVASRSNSVGRVLVVQISDLKDKLEIQSEKKQSFRVFDQKDHLDNVGSGNKRKRKTLDRKGSYRPQKRSRTRIEKEIAKQRLPRCRRGRSNYPVVRKVEQIVPVVSKDLWHREMEKMEEELASSNRALDKNAFLLFLGLKKVEAS
ncbi:uncharacterized protein LOC116295737 [Actinia tenebrosa]|uniref:Uncharacterized protein LOC116295737 n=1 Tax=Actinia tenebrosa TaxID=6105 RepID=A0A6P8HSY7_ACTTE|nr:uncharacterized protein LOC116295737 [Actinia tenebrosa]